MKRFVLAASLVLACLGARAQGVMPADTLPPRPSVDLLNDGVSTVRLKRNPAEGKVVRVVATGAKKPNYAPTKRSSSAASKYVTGPRGGCYYLNASGNKVYVDHSYCQ